MSISLRYTGAINQQAGKQSSQNAVFPSVGKAQTSSKLFLVATGYGAGRQTDYATKLFANALQNYFTNIQPPQATIYQPYINDAVNYAQTQVRNHHEANAQAQPIRANLCFALAYVNDDSSISLAWLGDASIFHCRAQQIVYKTSLHKNPKTGETVYLDATKPVQAQTIVLRDFEPQDTLLLCSRSLMDLFSDRNIRYLLSQGDGVAATYDAILDKVVEVGQKNALTNYAAYLLCINAPKKRVVSQQTIAPASTAATAQTVDTKAHRSLRKKSSANWKKRLGILLILALVGAAFVYKYGEYQYNHSPNAFKELVEEGKIASLEGDAEKAKTLFAKASSLSLPDSLNTKARLLLLRLQEKELTETADALFAKGDLLKAKEAYQKIIELDDIIRPVQDAVVQHKIKTIDQNIANEKHKLYLQARTAMAESDYENAKRLLYDALYYVQKDTFLQRWIDTCNVYLEEK